MIDTNLKIMATAQIIVILIPHIFDILNKDNRVCEKIGWGIAVASALLAFFVIWVLL